MERAASVLARLLVLAGAVGLVGSLFLPWFELQGYVIQGTEGVAGPEVVPSPGPGGELYGDLYTGWEAFEVSDVLLGLAAVATAIGLGLAMGLEARWRFLGIALLGGAALVLALFSIYRPGGAPGVGVGGVPHVGFLGALLSGGAIAVGALWAGPGPPVTGQARPRNE